MGSGRTPVLAFQESGTRIKTMTPTFLTTSALSSSSRKSCGSEKRSRRRKTPRIIARWMTLLSSMLTSTQMTRSRRSYPSLGMTSSRPRICGSSRFRPRIMLTTTLRFSHRRRHMCIQLKMSRLMRSLRKKLQHLKTQFRREKSIFFRSNSPRCRLTSRSRPSSSRILRRGSWK